jgi:exodeoxyribonuclease VII large subunit
VSESFFDFRARITSRRPTPTAATTPSGDVKALSVAELTAKIDSAIRAGVPQSILVKGELSNLNIHRGSGHIYFTLKDDRSCIDGVMFRSDAERLKVTPRDGDEVLISGSVRVYAQRGRYQLYATSMSPIGKGALEARFQQLKEKLEREGLFAPDRKKRLPRFPQRIALVSSREAAALQDMLKVLRRFPWVKLFMVHVPVQGDGAAAKIASALKELSRGGAADLILLARGGGSLEDLWQFNEEAVARAIAVSRVPIITGIGHEVDVSIADLVADYHAHTPTEAAQVAMAGWKQASDVIDGAGLRLRRSLRQLLSEARQRVLSIERHELFRRPTDRINRLRQSLDDRDRQLRSALAGLAQRAQRRLMKLETRLHAHQPRMRLTLARQQVESLRHLMDQQHRAHVTRVGCEIDGFEKQLEALNPHGVLRRGYSITSLKSGRIVRSVADVKGGEVLVTQLGDGTIESTAKDPNQPELF